MAVEYIFLVIIQIAAFILSIATFKVKIKVLNDSREMMIIVYTTTTILIILGIFTFALGTKFILNEVLYCLGVLIATTVFIALTFVPKVRSSL